MSDMDGGEGANEGYLAVTVMVPTARLAEFHSMYGRWLARGEPGESLSETAGDLPPASPGAPPGGGELPWGEGDLAEATAFLEALSVNALFLIDLWLSAPEDEWVSADASAEVAGLKGPEGVSGSLSSVGRAMKRVGRPRPYEHRVDADGGAYYRIREPVRTLFLRARGHAEAS